MLVGVASGYFLFKQPLDEYWRPQEKRGEEGSSGAGEKKRLDADPNDSPLSSKPSFINPPTMAFTVRHVLLIAILATLVAVAVSYRNSNSDTPSDIEATVDYLVKVVRTGGKGTIIRRRSPPKDSARSSRRPVPRGPPRNDFVPEECGRGISTTFYTFAFHSKLAPASTRFRIMAFTQARRALILAFFAAMVAVAFADYDDNRGNSFKPERFNSKLVGANEIPKNDSEAARNAVGDKTGVVKMNLGIHKRDGKPIWMAYSVKAWNLEGEMPPTKTHIHPGSKGEVNPVLLDLPCTYQQKSRKMWLCEGSVGEPENERTRDLLSALEKITKHPHKFYGNIHTKKYPDGAVRGQFSRG
ncbi:unnamed protein product [Closterium sp. Yama58-4]|nr:unnamed protein product [Closterium sp. Yama58-4]